MGWAGSPAMFSRIIESVTERWKVAVYQDEVGRHKPGYGTQMSLKGSPANFSRIIDSIAHHGNIITYQDEVINAWQGPVTSIMS